MKRSRILFLTIAVLLIVLLSVGLSFYIQNRMIAESDTEVQILVVIDFGTLKETENHVEYYINITEGSSALKAFSLVAELTVENFPLGAYIQGVNGYLEEGGDFWFFYYFDTGLEEWVYSSVGVSHYYLYEGDRIKLQYSG